MSFCQNSSLLMVRVGDRAEFQPRDTREVVWITGVERNSMCDRARCNKRVVRARSRLAPRCAQRRGNAAKRPPAIAVERNDVKVSLSLLQVLLTCAALSIIVCDMWAYGQLRQCYCANHRFVG